MHPCCVLKGTLGELAPLRMTILGFRDFSHFSTEFNIFFQYFLGFISRDAVLRFRLKFNKFVCVFIQSSESLRASASDL